MIFFCCLARNDAMFDGLTQSIRAASCEVPHVLRMCDSQPTMATGMNALVRAARAASADPTDVLAFPHQDTRLHFDWAVLPRYFAGLKDRTRFARPPGVLGFIGVERIPLSGWWWEGRGPRGGCHRGRSPMQGGETNWKYETKWCILNGGLRAYPVQGMDGLCLVMERGMLDAIGDIPTDLGGWHFYDSDICLTAERHGYQNYVIDEKIQHLEAGGMFNAQAWAETQKSFRRKWMAALAKP